MKADDLFEVRGNVVFITGAASGLGFAFSEVLAESGAHVVLADIDALALEEKTALLRAAGWSCEPVVVDVGDFGAIRVALDAVARTHGRLDTVFANAGISGGPGVFTEAGSIVNLDLAAFERLMHVNVMGTVATVQASAANMIPRKRGRIIITTSAAALRSEPMVAYSYSISKAALVHLIRHTAVELAPHGILVSGIAPGPIRTNLGGGAMLKNPEISAKLAAHIPLRRIGEPDELKGLALYLASSASSYMTGNIIAIDGGSLA